MFSKDRFEKLAGLGGSSSGMLNEGKQVGIKDPKADHFGGGKVQGDPWANGKVTTEGAEDEEFQTSEAKEEEECSEGQDEETQVREMIRNELKSVKQEMHKEKVEEAALRTEIRRQIKETLKSKRISLGMTGPGFKR